MKGDLGSMGICVLDKGVVDSDSAVSGAVVVKGDDVDGVLFDRLPVDNLYCDRPAIGDMETRLWTVGKFGLDGDDKSMNDSNLGFTEDVVQLEIRSAGIFDTKWLVLGPGGCAVLVNGCTDLGWDEDTEACQLRA